MPNHLTTAPNAASPQTPSGFADNFRTPVSELVQRLATLVEHAQMNGPQTLLTELQQAHSAAQQLGALLGDGFSSAISPAKEDQSIPANVLVADDIEANRELLKYHLVRQGYTVKTAYDGKQALDMLHTQPFDLVLLDIMMPEMDGYEVLEHLKADEHLKHIPVVIVSALSEVSSVARCIELGAEDYLPKPFNSTLLKARVRACLDKKRAHDREMLLFDQLQQNYKRLQELEKLRDDLTHMIIHDLRTPLTSVIVGLQTLEALGDLNEEQQEIMGISLEGSETLLGMINDLLDVEKLEDGSMPLEYTEFCAHELLNSSLAQVASLAHSKDLTLAQNVEGELPKLHGDEDKLRRTLVNLLGNAIKFTPQNGQVTVDVAHCAVEQHIRFAVSDTGEGIPNEAFDRIFEKFGQVESRRSGRTLSTGLGLTFCKLAVEAHRGQIGVESALGQGSTFYFTLPVA